MVIVLKSYNVMGSTFKIPAKYEIIDPTGAGAYGVVGAVITVSAVPSAAAKDKPLFRKITIS